MNEQTQPTDAELIAFATEEQFLLFCDPDEFTDIARAVLAKWGTPAGAGDWRSAVLDLIDDCPGLMLEQDHWLSRRVKELDFASTPQPTQAQAGAVPLTVDEVEQLIAQWSYELHGDRARYLVRMTEQHHGIKGADHGL